jgi:hypothetical protein
MKRFNPIFAKKRQHHVADSSKTAEDKHYPERDKIFDNVARILGSTMPRRKALKLALAGVAGAALLELGIRPAWAIVSCDCNGQSYDTDTSCCTPSGVQQKYPIVDLSACPNKVPHPGFVAVPNGCGPSGGALTPIIPNRFGSADFTQCCNTHDICYGTCNDVKSDCDNSFLACLQGSCRSAYSSKPVRLRACLSVANIYFRAVSSRGENAYESAQKEACDCCGTQTCGNCSPGVCGTFTICASAPGSPPDCYCFATAEGGGRCSRDFFCSSTAQCTNSSQCGPGSVCVVNTCCGPQGYCTPVCSPSINPVVLTRQSTLSGGPTASGKPL